MKKNNRFLAFVPFLLAMFCATVNAQNDYPPASYYPILPDGIGPVRLERNIRDLPDVCPGLYASLQDQLGLVYQFDTTYVYFNEPCHEKIKVSTVLNKYTPDGKLISHQEYAETAFLTFDIGFNKYCDRVYKLIYLDPEQKIPLGRKVFDVETDPDGTINCIRIYDPAFKTLSGYGVGTSLWDFYQNENFDLVYETNLVPHIEADGVRFRGFISNMSEDPDNEELIEEAFGQKLPAYIKGAEIHASLPALLRDDPTMIENELRINKAKYIEIRRKPTPESFKVTMEKWKTRIDVPDDLLYDLPYYLDPNDIELIKPKPGKAGTPGTPGASGTSGTSGTGLDNPTLEASLIQAGYDKDGDGRITDSELKGVQKVNLTLVTDIYNRNYLSFRGIERFVDAEELTLSVPQDIWDSHIRSYVKYETPDEIKDRYFRTREELNEVLGYYEWKQSDGTICRLYRTSDAAPKNIMLSRNRPRFTLDLRPLKKLKKLKCDNMFLGHLLLDAPGLEVLDCYDNYLESFDAKAFPELTWLDISRNPIQRLDLTPLSKLDWLYCYSPTLAELVITDQQYLDGVSVRREERHIHPNTRITVIETLKPLEVPKPAREGNIDFVDPILKSFLIQDHPVIDADKDGEISYEEASQVKNLLLKDGSHFKNITSTEDLRHFIKLQELMVEGDYEMEGDKLTIYSEVREMDVSPLSELTSLHCGLPLHTLTLGELEHLEILTLSIAPEGMEELDISGCPSLKFITFTNKGTSGVKTLKLTPTQKLKVSLSGDLPESYEILIPQIP